MSDLRSEISRRRTFAIISHPDAGKTTLTEKFLLYGGAIAQAGEVKGKRARAATSDWMEIEKQRGISVTSSVHAVPAQRLLHQHPGHPRPPGLLRGHLPHPDGRGLRRHGHRRRQGRGAPDPEALQGLRPAAHPHLHLHQQDGPGDPGPSGAVRGGGAGAGHRHLRRQLAHRLRQGVPGRLRPGEAAHPVLPGGGAGQEGQLRGGGPGRPGPGGHDRREEGRRPPGGGGAAGGRPGVRPGGRAERHPVPRVLRLRPHHLRRGALPGGVPPHDHAAPAPVSATRGRSTCSPRTSPPLSSRSRPT